MKHLNLLKSTLLLCALVAGSTSVWAADVTITFNSSSKVNSDGTINQSPYDEGNIVLSAAQNGSNDAPFFSGSQLRLYAGSSGNGCSATITSATKWIQTVVFTFSANTYAAASQGKYTYTSGTTGTWSGGGHNAKTVTLQNTNKSSTQVRITKIEITYGDAPTVINPVFSATSGYIAKGSAVELSTETAGADIYYTTNGSTPTASSTHYTGAITVNNDVTIKAIAIKGGNESEVVEADYAVYTPVPGLSIDFEESAIVAYSDWEFVNIGIHNSAITAHGGSAWGSNVNANGNGTTTCSITTKAKIAHPGTFTCYISKESGNTTESSWKIQTSTDGSSWKDVATKDAIGMDKGVWQEFSADLSTYTNVFVRLSYGSNKALRAVDDITLTEAAVFAAGKTMISFSDANVALDLAHMPSGLKAYKVSSANASSVTLTEVTEAVAKNTGLILTGTAGETYNIPVIGSGSDISASNLLVAANGTDNVTSAYVLSNGKFHPVAAAGVVIPAGKAYLPAGSLSAHELDITFDNGDVTGIEAVETQKAFDGVFYNLNGQRIAQPTKGLYIVNGKKVVIK